MQYKKAAVLHEIQQDILALKNAWGDKEQSIDALLMLLY